MLLFTQLQSGIKSGRKTKLRIETGYRFESAGRTKEKLRSAASDHVAMRENNPERVASYFQDPYVKYAA